MASVRVGNDDVPTSVVIQSDGKILVSGTVYQALNDNFVVARFNDDGTPDTNFNSAGGAGGTAMIDFGGIDDATSLAVQSDKKIVIAGYTRHSNRDPNTHFALARLN